MGKTQNKLQKQVNKITIKPIRDINSKNQKKKKAKQLNRQMYKEFKKIINNFSKL